MAKYDDRLRGDDARRIVVLEPAELVQRPDDEELRREGRDREIQSANAQARQAEDDADQRGANAGKRDGNTNGMPSMRSMRL